MFESQDRLCCRDPYSSMLCWNWKLALDQVASRLIQTPGRIQEVEPPILDLIGYCANSQCMYFLDPPRSPRKTSHRFLLTGSRDLVNTSDWAYIRSLELSKFQGP